MIDKQNNDNDSSLSVDKSTREYGSINPGSGQPGKHRRMLLPAAEYVEGIKNGSRAMLSRAITLIESTKTEHRERAREIIEECLPDTGNAVRVGITGVPGVGKSTFIESLGNHIVDRGRRLAVLTVDPSSMRSRGSILGDKTRMETLARHNNTFIRPSPTGGSLGGVARKTREAIYLCEAAGYDVIFIETVGVGQSETAVHSMVDFFLLLMIAGAGDELQGIKRGVMEMADLIAINKIDEAGEKAVQQAVREYRSAMRLYPERKSGWSPKVVTCSARTRKGIAEIWELIREYIRLAKKNRYFEDQRSRQAKHWMYDTIENQLKDHFFEHPGVKRRQSSIERKVLKGELSSFQAARQLLDLYFGSPEDKL